MDPLKSLSILVRIFSDNRRDESSSITVFLTERTTWQNDSRMLSVSKFTEVFIFVNTVNLSVQVQQLL